MKPFIDMNIKTLLIAACGAILLLTASCGEDEVTAPSITERVKGTWILTSFQTDCTDDTLDEILERDCDEMNCTRIILGDNSYSTITTVNGRETRIDEFYLFIIDADSNLVGSQIEICDGIDFNRNCRRSFEVEQTQDMLSLIRRSTDEDCFDSFVYIKEEDASTGD